MELPQINWITFSYIESYWITSTAKWAPLIYDLYFSLIGFTEMEFNGIKVEVPILFSFKYYKIKFINIYK